MKKVLIQAYIWPEWTSSAAGLRDRNLIETFMNQGWEVTVASGAKPNGFQKKIEAMGVQTYFCEPNDSRYDDWVRELNPEIVVFDRFITEEQFSFRVRAQCPNALRVLDTQDLHFVRRARQKAIESGVEDIRDIDFQSDDLTRELCSIFRSDLTWVLSTFELKLLQDTFRNPDCRLSRFHYKPSLAVAPYSERKGFVWIGNFRHPPNWDALQWFRAQIWPTIRREDPAAFIDIFGSYPPKAAMDMNDPNAGFFVKGPIENHLAALGKYRVLLAPLRYGAGIKGKITDAWHVGTPVVTTWVGGEGIADLGDSRFGGVIVAAENFAYEALALSGDERKWSAAQKTGLALMTQYFDLEKNSNTLILDLDFAVKNIRESRKKNQVGELLWYQGNRSTEYFSRWIEAKEKKPQ